MEEEGAEALTQQGKIEVREKTETFLVELDSLVQEFNGIYFCFIFSFHFFF